MRNNFRFLIENEFKSKLFRDAVEKKKSIKILAKILGCIPDNIRLMRNERTRFIKWRIIYSLMNINGISEEELEKHVLAVKAGKSGRINKVLFPIKESKELALLVAKTMGDGSIEKNFRFSYWNNERILINEFCKCVRISSGRSKITINRLEDGRIQAKCNPFVGLIAHLNGAPIGNKTLQDYDVPEWIKNGSKEMKASFVRGLFDDESHVQFNIKNRTKRIVIAQGKWTKKIKSLEKFLNSIRKILLDIGIDSTRVRKQAVYTDKEGREKVILNFSICGKGNLKRFYKDICFTSNRKKGVLKSLNSSSNKKI